MYTQMHQKLYGRCYIIQLRYIGIYLKHYENLAAHKELRSYIIINEIKISMEKF